MKEESKKTTKTIKTTTKPVAKVQAKPTKKGATLNQDLNLLIGLFGILTLIVFGFAFEATKSSSLSGWELLLKSGSYSGVFKGFMITYFITLIVDCVLAVRIDSENEIFNIVEKILYVITLVINFAMIVMFINLIENIGIGLILFFILSILSILIKFVRIYSQK